MENVEIDDSEFYHQDFTTASDWEIFIARIEEILHEWKLTSHLNNVKYPAIVDGEWESKTESLHFADVEFIMTHHFMKPLPESSPLDEDAEEYDDSENEFHYIFQELEFSNQDFVPLPCDDQPSLCLARIYGVRNFVAICPSKNVDVNNESKAKILLSSVRMAVNNCNCEIPLFVQIGEHWQQLYLGVCEARGLATNFDMIHLQNGPHHCKYLNGLQDVFKAKIASPIPLDPIMVSVQFSYSLVFGNKFEFRRRETIVKDDLGKLQFGVILDPFSEMTLLATWQNIPEKLVVDSETYSDFDPLQAASWSVKIKMIDSPACFLSDCTLEFLHLHGNNSTLSDLLGDYISDSNNDTVNALNRITESKVPSLTSVIRRATSGNRDGRKRSRSSDGPISDEFLVPILYFLFPDAENEPKRPYTGDFEHPPETGALTSCGFDSLVWRLAIILAQAAHSLGGARTVAHIWYEFVQEMRFRWERNIKIPGIPSEPSLRSAIKSKTSSPGTRTPSSGMKSPIIRLKPPSPGTKSPRSGTKSPRSGTKSPRSGTKSPSPQPSGASMQKPPTITPPKSETSQKVPSSPPRRSRSSSRVSSQKSSEKSPSRKSSSRKSPSHKSPSTTSAPPPSEMLSRKSIKDADTTLPVCLGRKFEVVEKDSVDQTYKKTPDEICVIREKPSTDDKTHPEAFKWKLIIKHKRECRTGEPNIFTTTDIPPDPACVCAPPEKPATTDKDKKNQKKELKEKEKQKKKEQKEQKEKEKKEKKGKKEKTDKDEKIDKDEKKEPKK